MRKFLIMFSLGTLLGSLVILSGSYVHSAVPHLITYQGMLTDNGGIPLTGSYDLTFRIYDDTTGGNLEWTETQSEVQVEDGLFNVVLGQETTLDLPFDESYWLELQVGSEIMPRLRFTSTGYAYRVSVADSATATGGDGDWAVSGDNMYSAVTGNVGIGTSSPGVKLNVDGGSDAAASVENSGYLIIGSPTGEHIAIDNNEIMAKSDGTHGGILYLSKGATGTYFHGPVAIGTPNLTGECLDVVGGMIVRGGEIRDAGGTRRITFADHDRLDLREDGGSVALSIDTLGRVGVGTTEPSERLSVAEDIQLSGKVIYSSPRTHYLSFGPAAFRPSENEYYWSSEVGVFTDYQGSPPRPLLVAPVNLPQGAVVTEFTVYFYDDDFESMAVRLERKQISTHVYQTLGRAESIPVSGWGSDTDSNIDYATIDNTTYTYSIRDDGYSKPNIRIVQAVIAYTISEIP